MESSSGTAPYLPDEVAPQRYAWLLVLRNADPVVRVVSKADIRKATRKARPSRVSCVCPPSKLQTARRQHYAEPTTTRTLVGQLRL